MMVDFTAMEHAVRRLVGVWPSAATVASAWCAPSLMILIWPLVESALASFLRRGSEILIPIFWWPTNIRIDVVHWLGVAALIIIITRRPWSFILLWSFSLLLKLAEVLDLRLAEFCELFIELRHYFWLFPD
jgi:hypothetical protein